MDQIGWHWNDIVCPPQRSVEYDVPDLGLTARAGVDATASQTRDRQEGAAGESVEHTLFDQETFEHATNLAKDKQQIEREKSEGVRKSKTVEEWWPKCGFVGVVSHPGTECRKSTEREKSVEVRQASDAIFELREVRPIMGATEEQYCKILAGKTPQQIEEMNEHFKERHRITLQDHLKEKFGPSWTSFEDVLAAANKWEAGENY